MPDPPIRFTPWTRWEERNALPNSHLPGVYLLAQFDGPPPRRIDPLAEDVIYIGEIYDNSLQSRWQQFHRSAFEGKPGHSGGVAYRDVFGDAGETLYVAAFVPEGLSRELRALYIRYVERKLVWEYARAGARRRCATASSRSLYGIITTQSPQERARATHVESQELALPDLAALCLRPEPGYSPLAPPPPVGGCTAHPRAAAEEPL